MMNRLTGLFSKGWIGTAALAAALLLAVPAARAGEADAVPGVLSPGDAVVTGFSGTLPPPEDLPDGVDPLDYVFIDPDGTSMQIDRLLPDGPPAGQLIEAPAVFSAPARDVGQVFAVTLDDEPAPNIYLGATSAFGIHIVAPDEEGALRHVRQGTPGAQFMQGQWGTDKGGAPGSIYRVDGRTGEITLFSSIGTNAGPGLGDVVFDRASRQFFASDLDTGLIYRLDSTGLISDTFDHGVAARPANGQAPLADDGSRMDISSPAFSSEDPASWGLTPAGRRIGGMAVHGGRLYYAVAEGPEVWSVGIDLDGSFLADPRWELDVGAPAADNPVTDIVFDSAGRMILAQRGAQRGSFDDSVFAEPKTAAVLRYAREIPDDPATPGSWKPVPDEYAVGFRPALRNTNGGVALGYGHDASGALLSGACNAFLWTTGEALRDDPALAERLAAGGPAIVDGLQGNDASLVKPANAPPFSSYFTDYDGDFEHPERQGWMGDVEIFQPCSGASQGSLGFPGYLPPPIHFPPGYQPPPSGSFNLTLHKVAAPRVCRPGREGWICHYTIRVTNTGTVPYWGPLTVRDWMPDLAPGAMVRFDVQPPWMCGATGPVEYECTLPGVFLLPGDGVELYVTVAQPGGPAGANRRVNDRLCYAANNAEILWWDGYGDANPGDDFDHAEAQIPDEACLPRDGGTNLRIFKRAARETCRLHEGSWNCAFEITVINTGPGVYTGPIELTEDTGGVGTITYGPQPNPPDWTCVPAGGNYSCTHAPVTLNPGQGLELRFAIQVAAAEQERAQRCSVVNRVRIARAPGGSPRNLDPADDAAEAEAMTPGKNCEPPPERKSDLSLTKRSTGCSYVEEEGGFVCGYTVAVRNEGPDAFAGMLTVHEEVSHGPGVGYVLLPPWNCVASPPGYDCSLDLAGAPLAPGAVRLLQVMIAVRTGSQVCEVRNEARIIAPLGGSNQNSNAGNDASGPVVQPVPSPECNPPPPPQSNLAITKTARGCTEDGPNLAAANVPGATCLYEVSIRNTGPDQFGGVISFRDESDLPGAAQITAAPAGWACGSVGPAAGCSFDGIMPAGAGASFSVSVRTNLAAVRANQCRAPNTARITMPIGAPQNTDPADDIASAVAEMPGLCEEQLPLTIDVCPVDRQMPDQGCCPAGQKWNGRACAGGPIIGKVCPPYTTGRYPDCRPLLIRLCPPDSVGKYPNCACRRGTFGIPGNCRERLCPQGSTGKWPNCEARIKRCPAGTHGRWPDCDPNICPQGTVGKWPNCERRIRDCPKGTVGKWPNCERRIRDCPKGTVGKWPNCERIVRDCPKGTVGKWPNCERIVRDCPKGTVGKWPNCERRIKDCPKGTVGKWPNCERIVRDCPKGTVGKWPNCERRIKECPPGSRGKWPNCRKPNTSCPDGMVYSRRAKTCVSAQQEQPEQPKQPKLRKQQMMIAPENMQPQ